MLQIDGKQLSHYQSRVRNTEGRKKVTRVCDRLPTSDHNCFRNIECIVKIPLFNVYRDILPSCLSL